jgi:ABC-type phosphate transport system substrate-binding protein
MVTKVLSCLLLIVLVLCLGGCGGQSGGEFAIHVYTRSDASGAADEWAAYLGNYHQEDLKGTGVYGDPGLAEAVKKDPLGIGYNNLNYAYDMDTGQPIAGLRVVPIDLNEDGQIDASEDFYATKGELMQAIATGQYPSPPARDLYFVTKDMFTGIAKEFVRWVLTEGQQYVVEVGYVALSSEKVTEQLNKLGDTESEDELAGTITVSGAWALYPMVVRWAEVFRELHPDVKIDISAGGAGKGMVDALNGMVDIGMVSREIYPSEIEEGAFWVAVTRDCVVPVVNEDNPVLEDLMTKGIKRETLADIWVTGMITDWRDVVS